jgi:chorismate mutase
MKPGEVDGGAMTAAATAEELGRLRNRIDEIDRRIVALLNERAAVGIEIGRIKASAGRTAMFDADREQEVLRQVAGANVGPIDEPALLGLYQQIIDLTRRLEESQREREMT